MYAMLDFLRPKGRMLYRALRFTQVIDNPAVAAKFFRSIWSKDLIECQEQFVVVFLNEDNIPIDYKCLHTGGANNVSVDMKVLFKEVCNSNCDAIIIAHNHTNGSLKAGVNDRKTTADIQAGCRLFGVSLNDHIILTKKSYFSFLESGLLSLCFCLPF